MNWPGRIAAVFLWIFEAVTAVVIWLLQVILQIVLVCLGIAALFLPFAVGIWIGSVAVKAVRRIGGDDSWSGWRIVCVGLAALGLAAAVLLHDRRLVETGDLYSSVMSSLESYQWKSVDLTSALVNHYFGFWSFVTPHLFDGPFAVGRMAATEYDVLVGALFAVVPLISTVLYDAFRMRWRHGAQMLLVTAAFLPLVMYAEYFFVWFGFTGLVLFFHFLGWLLVIVLGMVALWVFGTIFGAVSQDSRTGYPRG